MSERTTIPTSAEAFKGRRAPEARPLYVVEQDSDSTDTTPSSDTPDIIDADVVEDDESSDVIASMEAQFPGQELRGDNPIDRATSRFVQLASRLQERRVTTQNRRDARNELTNLSAAATYGDDARAEYETRVLDLLDSKDTKIAGYAEAHAGSEFGRLNREVWREDAKDKLKSLGRSALRGIKLGAAVTIGAGVLGAEAAGKGIKRGVEASVTKTSELKDTAATSWDGATEAYAYHKQEKARDRQKRADKSAAENLRYKQEAAKRAAKARERKATRKELLKQLADTYTSGTAEHSGRHREELNPTETAEKQRKRTSRLGNLALKFGAAREAFKTTGSKDADPNQDKLF